MQETTTTENEGRSRRPEREPGARWAWHGTSRKLGALIMDAGEITPEGEPPPPCWFGHLDESPLMPEPCERKAHVYVNGIPLCEIHGAEAEAGVLEEMYFEASQFFARFENPYVLRPDNRAVVWALEAGVVGDLGRRCLEAESREREALVLAYPLRRELMDPEVRAHDYSQPGEVPADWFHPHRMLIHKLQRIAHEDGASSLVERLEGARQATTVQLAYAIQDAEKRQDPRR
jgi:hypothetical protein